MAFGPKSAQRKARSSRTIKRFAQRYGLRGRDELVDTVAAGLVTASMNSGVTGISGPASSVHKKLQARGLPKDESFRIVVAGVDKAVMAFRREGISLL